MSWFHFGETARNQLLLLTLWFCRLFQHFLLSLEDLLADFACLMFYLMLGGAACNCVPRSHFAFGCNEAIYVCGIVQIWVQLSWVFCGAWRHILIFSRKDRCHSTIVKESTALPSYFLPWQWFRIIKVGPTYESTCMIVFSQTYLKTALVTKEILESSITSIYAVTGSYIINLKIKQLYL